MARQARPAKPSAYPPVPEELLTLIDDQGRYRRRGFVPGEPDEDWERYKAFKMAYCQEAAIPLSKFSAAIQDQH